MLTMSNRGQSLIKLRAKIFKALSDPVRLQILEYIRPKEKCVCEITPHLKLAQPLISRHLKILKGCGLVKERKDGNRRIYSVTERKLFRMIDELNPELIEALSKKMMEQIVS